MISLTSFLSKVSEQFVISWLLQYVGEKIDWGQYGGTKGSSISHYLIELVNFVLFNHDLNIPHAAQSWQCLRSLWWEVWLWEERRLETKTGQGTALKLECLVVSLLRVSSLSTTLARGLRSASLLGSEL